MKKTLVKLGACALAAVLAVGSSAQADPTWTYTAEAKSYTGTGPNPVAVANSSIDFIPAYGSGSVNGSGVNSVIVYKVKTNTTAPQADAMAYDFAFDLPVTLVNLAAQGAASDPTAKATGTVNLSGYLKATDVSGSTFTYQDHGLDTTVAEKLSLGSTSTGWWDYVVKAISFTPPGVPVGDNATGSIYVSVTVTKGVAPGGSGGDPDPDPDPDPQATPEPTSLLLAALGLPVALVARRRRKAAQAAAIV